jgi:hypothetical protein
LGIVASNGVSNCTQALVAPCLQFVLWFNCGRWRPLGICALTPSHHRCLPAHCVTGGEYSREYTLANMLKENTAVYCSCKSRNVTVLLEHSAPTSFVMTHAVLRAPPRGSFTAPVKGSLLSRLTALIFYFSSAARALRYRVTSTSSHPLARTQLTVRTSLCALRSQTLWCLSRTTACRSMTLLRTTTLLLRTTDV